MPYRYSTGARLLHWLTAFLVLVMFVAGIWIVYFEPKDSPALEHALFMVHESTGVVVFAVVLLRLLRRLGDPPAPLPDSVPSLFRLAAKVNHALLYVLLLAQAVVGFLNANAAGVPLVLYGLVRIPSPIGKDEALAPILSSLHWWIAVALLAAIAAHVAGACYHGLIRRDGVVARMLG